MQCCCCPISLFIFVSVLNLLLTSAFKQLLFELCSGSLLKFLHFESVCWLTLGLWAMMNIRHRPFAAGVDHIIPKVLQSHGFKTVKDFSRAIPTFQPILIRRQRKIQAKAAASIISKQILRVAWDIYIHCSKK